MRTIRVTVTVDEHGLRAITDLEPGDGYLVAPFSHEYVIAVPSRPATLAEVAEGAWKNTCSHEQVAAAVVEAHEKMRSPKAGAL